MLYDDSEQLEVRHVISLEYHTVSVYGGGDEIPEGELWTKRNAICLTRTPALNGDRTPSLPFYLFSENLSEKEDFYFALLKNQEKIPDTEDSTPSPQKYDVKHILSLLQRLHSSEDQLQTRWLNAMLGKLFLALYKTHELEAFIRKKLTKKISRVKKPAFITKLVLQKIDMGEGAPFVTNPKLRDLTVNGDCTIEADVKYSGKFRIEVAATARIDLGSRFKAREVEFVLAVVVNRGEGRALLRSKPPPSNRLWLTFESMPKLDMTIEPIVSARQITYNVILRAIESRIREVIAETIVLPYWDDFAFLDTENEKYRGGIWKKKPVAVRPEEIHANDPEDEAEACVDNNDVPNADPLKAASEKTISKPALPPSPRSNLRSRNGARPAKPLKESFGNGSSQALDKSTYQDKPRALRPNSFAVVADPMLTTNHADAETGRRGTDTMQKRDVASALLKDLSAKSPTTSPVDSPVGTPPNEIVVVAAMKGNGSSVSSRASNESLSKSIRPPDSVASSAQATSDSSVPLTPPATALNSATPPLNETAKRSSPLISVARSLALADNRQPLGTVASATVAARDWGWGVLSRNRQRAQEAHARPGTPDHPIGRGRPLPPPGTPLPPPERPSTKAVPQTLKRKAVPPLLPKRPSMADGIDPQPPPRPPLPERRTKRSLTQPINTDADEVLIVPAPTSPAASEHQDDSSSHGEDTEERELEIAAMGETSQVRPGLPSQSSSHQSSTSTASSTKDTTSDNTP